MSTQLLTDSSTAWIQGLKSLECVITYGLRHKKPLRSNIQGGSIYVYVLTFFIILSYTFKYPFKYPHQISKFYTDNKSLLS